jgi:hypothetical protein
MSKFATLFSNCEASHTLLSKAKKKMDPEFLEFSFKSKNI